MQRNKYGARKTVSGGITFDSKREARRWDDLQALLRDRKIGQLERQVRFELAPSVTLAGETRKKPAIRYVADFRYFDVEKGHVVVEDAKGRDTPVSRLKRHLMKGVHGIDVVLS